MNQRDAIDLAVENLANDGLSDISAESLEKRLIMTFKEDFKNDVDKNLKKSSIEEMGFKPIQYMLTPKNRYVFDYRKAAIVQPACLAKYTALVLMAASEIEENRIPVSDNRVFSARFSPHGHRVFLDKVGYGEWRHRTKELAEQGRCKYIASCDIAAFYDRVNIHRIESTLGSIGVPLDLVKKINELLLFWSKKDSYGLPVGNIASRILAEAALIDVDQYLLSEGIEFTRYVDDYRLFAPSLVAAQRWMNKLNTRLLRDGLTLNTGKTRLRLVGDDSEEEDAEGQSRDTSKDEEAEEVLRVVTRLTGGYSRIARRFLMPADEKHEVFKDINIPQEMGSLKERPIVEFAGIQKLVIACLVQKNFDALVELAFVCSDYMYSLDYFVDMLIKNHKVIPASQRDKIADYFEERITGSDFYSFEWHFATIAKLLSHSHYFRKRALLQIFRSPTKDVVTYPSIIALEGLYGKLSRSEFRTIREWFDRCDDWEKRRLLHLSSALPDEERKAWVRAVLPELGNDFLASAYAKKIRSGNDVLA